MFLCGPESILSLIYACVSLWPRATLRLIYACISLWPRASLRPIYTYISLYPRVTLSFIGHFFVAQSCFKIHLHMRIFVAHNRFKPPLPVCFFATKISFKTHLRTHFFVAHRHFKPHLCVCFFATMSCFKSHVYMRFFDTQSDGSATNFQLNCLGPLVGPMEPPNRFSTEGVWSDWQACDLGWKVCGLKTKVAAGLGITGISLKCCPASKIEVRLC